MRPRVIGPLAAGLVLAGSALAQHHAPPTPYAGLERRGIKSLSEQQIADLKAGRGMGLALPAELNRYPGPMHVLELADPLRLSPEQRRRMEGLVEAMRAEVRPLGEEVIAAESALDGLFATARATPASVTEASGAAGAARGALRAAHLRYHLEAREALTPEQIGRYEELRGYAARR